MCPGKSWTPSLSFLAVRMGALLGPASRAAVGANVQVQVQVRLSAQCLVHSNLSDVALKARHPQGTVVQQNSLEWGMRPLLCPGGHQQLQVRPRGWSFTVTNSNVSGPTWLGAALLGRQF